MNTMLFVNATIGFYDNLFLVFRVTCSVTYPFWGANLSLLADFCLNGYLQCERPFWGVNLSFFTLTDYINGYLQGDIPFLEYTIPSV